MKLTNQALDAFGDQCKYNYEDFLELPESCQNALIIEFFDSVGIRIGIDPYYDMQGTYRANIEHQGFQSMYRNVAIGMAIEKANIIYNEN